MSHTELFYITYLCTDFTPPNRKKQRHIVIGNKLNLSKTRCSTCGNAAEEKKPERADQADEQTSGPNGARCGVIEFYSMC